MNISVRTVTPADAAAVANLSAQLGYPLSVDATTDYIKMIAGRENELICLAENDTDITGWIQISLLLRLESGPFFEIVGLVVDEK